MQFNDKYGRDRLPYYHKLRLEFYKGGDDMWKAYYAAYNYLVTDELKDREILNPSRAQALASHKNATKLLRQQIQRYKPLSLSKTSLTDEDPSLQEKFKEYLDDDSKAMLESLNNDYGYRFRKLSKQLRENYDQSTVLPYKFNIK